MTRLTINTKQFKDSCSKILTALDKSSLYNISDYLGLYANDGVLKLCITNKVYFVEIKYDLDTNIEFNATVNAELFLKLVSNITTEEITLEEDGNILVIKGNGVYKVPLIYDNDELLKVTKLRTPEIPRIETIMKLKDLKNIAQYNSKELQKQFFSDPIQKMYYIDDEGCLTFSTGATVTSFSLDKPIKLLIQPKIVKLFKLFNTDVKVEYFVNNLSTEFNESIARFSNETTTIETLLNDESLINKIPVSVIRSRANKEYNYSAVANKNDLVRIAEIIDLLNGDKADSICVIKAENDTLQFSDEDSNGSESIKLQSSIESKYEFKVDCKDLLLALSSISNEYITMNFGDENAIVLFDTNNNIRFVIPEVM